MNRPAMRRFRRGEASRETAAVLLLTASWSDVAALWDVASWREWVRERVSIWLQNMPEGLCRKDAPGTQVEFRFVGEHAYGKTLRHTCTPAGTDKAGRVRRARRVYCVLCPLWRARKVGADSGSCLRGNGRGEKRTRKPVRSSLQGVRCCTYPI